ncbi:MAG: hypothetical protein O9284_12470 [Steroidobacteraceae bacterium]|jgi:hypothetical protein|nr:hypothetical protein [Steroidobacteraceae bacterium]
MAEKRVGEHVDRHDRDPQRVVLDNPGREVGDDDRPGGPGLPTNQAGGRDGGSAQGAQNRGPTTRGSG